MRSGRRIEAIGREHAEGDLRLAELRVRARRRRGGRATRVRARRPGTGRDRRDDETRLSSSAEEQLRGSSASIGAHLVRQVLLDARAEREVARPALEHDRLEVRRVRARVGEDARRAPPSARRSMHVALRARRTSRARSRSAVERLRPGPGRPVDVSGPAALSSDAARAATYGPPAKPLVRKNVRTGTSLRRTIVRTVDDARRARRRVHASASSAEAMPWRACAGSTPTAKIQPHGSEPNSKARTSPSR